jgi:hypothetical protein
MNIFDSVLSKSWEEKLLKDAAKRGRDAGANGLPTVETPKYDVEETEIRNQVSQRLAGLQQKLATELQAILPSLTKKDGDLKQAELKFHARQTADGVGDLLKGAFSNKRAEIETLFFRKHESEGNYKNFRLTNNVTIDPDHPADRLNYVSVIFLLLAVETLLNASYWSNKFGENYTQGILVAAFISAFNILIGFIGGIALSYKNLAAPRSRVLGWSGFLAACAVAAGVNLYVILRRGPSESGQEDVNQTINILMFCVGLAFALISAYKGYRFFGSVPGYEAASATYLAASASLKTAENSLREAVSSQVRAEEDVRKEITRTFTDAQLFFVKTRATLSNLASQYALAAQHLCTVLENSVGAYRQNNKAVKGALTKSPLWFDESVERFATETDTLGEAFRSLTAISEPAERLSDSLRATVAAELASLQTVKSAYLGESLTALMSDCNQSAHARWVEAVSGVGNQGRADRFL